MKDKIYFYRKAGEYVREALSTRRGCTNKYRIKNLGNDRKLLLCITRKKGPEGGKTKAIALLRHKDVDLRTVEKKGVRKVVKTLRNLRKHAAMENLLRSSLRSLTVSLRLHLNEDSRDRSRR